MSLDLEQRAQVSEETYVALLPPFWGKPKIASLLRSYTAEAQAVEDAAWLLFELVNVATADLPRLKLLGKLIGCSQNALDTEEFRGVIIARAIANRSAGTLGDLIAVLNSLLGPLAYTIVEPGNATLWVTALDTISDADAYRVAQVLPFARAGGVGLHFMYSDEADPEDVFIWGDLWSDAEVWGTVRVL